MAATVSSPAGPASPTGPEQMLLNLKIISELREYDKLIVTEDVLQIDHYSIFQGVKRWQHGDSRESTMRKLEQLSSDMFTYIDDSVKKESRKARIKKEMFEPDVSQILQQFFHAITNAITGLEHLRITYKTDIIVRSRLTLMIEKLNGKIEDLRKILRIDVSDIEPSSSS